MPNDNYNSSPLEWVEAYLAENTLQAHCIKGLLATQGIDAKLHGEALMGAVGEIPIDACYIKLMVKVEDKEVTETVLKHYEQALKNNPLDWFCHQCGENNATTFDLCWHCGHDPLHTTL
ncbi:putative signal transducing protein [Algibacillus agarilyticus]|uniref:putative signal transducing protein n=1 Tax=Algibacillus agarilyticus TaxID=2234133 RepID=UPI000DD03647|nr:DUF2007 domain-containing protein [Algibacillus agarilyticus]